MQTSRFLIKALLYLVIPLSSASDDIVIIYATTVDLEGDNLYVPAGYPVNSTGLQPQLRSLWEGSDAPIQVDSYEQKWKEIPLHEMSTLFGGIEELYLVIFENRAYKHQVTAAHIFEWGCDNSLIPVLDLGGLQFHPSRIRWRGTAIAVSSQNANLELLAVDPDLIPEEFYAYGQQPEGWEIWVDGVKRYSYIARDLYTVGPLNLLVDHLSGEVTESVRGSKFDIDC